MPMMICATDRVVETLRGHTFGFVKDVPLHVPPALVSLVMERGAYPAPGEEAAATQATEPTLTDKQREPSDIDARQRVLVEALRKLGAAGEIMFTAGGKPNPAQLSKAAGFRVDAFERDAAWEALSNTAN